MNEEAALLCAALECSYGNRHVWHVVPSPCLCQTNDVWLRLLRPANLINS